jgi:hypothetical protein
MDAGLTPFLLAKWVFVILAFVFVLLVARSLPQGHLVIKMAGAVATVNPEKLAELATEPGALSAFGRLLPHPSRVSKGGRSLPSCEFIS